MVSIFLLFSAVLAWYLGGIDAKAKAALSPVVWTFFCQPCCDRRFELGPFFYRPCVTATLIAVLLGRACVKENR
jgi:hypothetical protein